MRRLEKGSASQGCCVCGRGFSVPLCLPAPADQIQVSPGAVPLPPLLRGFSVPQCSSDQGRGDPATRTLFPQGLRAVSPQRAGRIGVVFTQAPRSLFLSEKPQPGTPSLSKEVNEGSRGPVPAAIRQRGCSPRPAWMADGEEQAETPAAAPGA